MSRSGIASGADADRVYFQLSLAGDPRTGVGSCGDDGFFRDARWGVQLDLDADPSTYEVALLIEGQGPERGVRLHTNATTTLANDVLDPPDAAVATYSACTHAAVEAEEDGTYTLTLAVERDALLDAANVVLSTELPSLTGDFTATAVTGSGGATFGADVACFDDDAQGALCAAGQPCPPLSDALSGPLVIDTFVDVHVAEGAEFGSTAPTITGLAEVGATVEVSDGTNQGTATVTPDGRFSFDVPGSWGWKKGDSVSLVVTATDAELHSETVQLEASVGAVEVAVALPGVSGILDSLLAPVEIFTDAPLGSLVEVQAQLGSGKSVTICSGLTLLGGLYLCVPGEGALYDGAGGTLTATVNTLLGKSGSSAASFLVDLLDNQSLPLLNLLGPADGTTSASGDILVTGTATDLNLADTVHITVTGDSEGVVFDGEVDLVEGGFNLPLTDLLDDTYTVTARVLDLAGHQVSVDVEVVIDSSATVTDPSIVTEDPSPVDTTVSVTIDGGAPEEDLPAPDAGAMPDAGTPGGGNNTTATGGTHGGETGHGSGGTTDSAASSPMVRAGNSIFGCSAGGTGAPGAWLAVLVLLALRGRRWTRSGTRCQS